MMAAMALLGVAEATIPMLISVDPNATAIEQFAAHELRDVLAQICPSMTFRVGAPLVYQPQFAVGPAAWSVSHDKSRLVNLTNESFTLFSSMSDPGWPHAAVAAVSGGVGAPRGTLYGVYSLAEALGVRYLAHDETVLPPCPAQLPALDIVQSAPSFEYRDDNQFQVSSSQGWATKRGFNGPSSAQPAALGGHLRYATPPGFVCTRRTRCSLARLDSPESATSRHRSYARRTPSGSGRAAPRMPPCTASSAGRTRRSWRL